MPTHDEFDTLNGFMVNEDGEYFPLGEIKSLDVTTTKDDSDDEWVLNFKDSASFKVDSVILGKRISAKRFKKLLMSIGMQRNIAEMAVIITRLKGIPYGDAWIGCSIMGWQNYISWMLEYA